jgi:chromosome segregation ATPase
MVCLGRLLPPENDQTIRPYGYSGTRAYLQAQDIAKDGVPALVQALEDALDRLAEHEECGDLAADVEELKADGDKAQEEIEALEKERDDLQIELDKLSEEDERVFAAQKAQKEAQEAKADASHWREMHGRAEAEYKRITQDRHDAVTKLRELQDSVREIVGDDPSALLTAVYWRTQAHSSGVELIALRKRVAELEAPSARHRTTKQLETDVAYWKKLAEERAIGRGT